MRKPPIISRLIKVVDTTPLSDRLNLVCSEAYGQMDRGYFERHPSLHPYSTNYLCARESDTKNDCCARATATNLLNYSMFYVQSIFRTLNSIADFKTERTPMIKKANGLKLPRNLAMTLEDYNQL